MLSNVLKKIKMKNKMETFKKINKNLMSPTKFRVK